MTAVRWSVLVPVKRLDAAKTRLAPAVAGPGAPARSELALALAIDTVAAALGCAGVARVVAVTSDEVAAEALLAAGAEVVPDAPEAGLDRALAHAAEVARGSDPGCAVAALSSDLPALRSDELSRALLAAGAETMAVVADEAGSGTVLLTAGPGVPLRPSYGPGSLGRHASLGAAVLQVDEVPGLRRDVDTPADLRAAAGLGLGRATSALLDRVLLPGGC